MTEIDTRTAGLLDELLWLACHAHERLTPDNQAGHEYLLGQRDTYARAAALSIATALGQDSALIAERILGAIQAGTTDLTDLQAVALNRQPAATPASTLEWLGHKAFDIRFGDAPGLDRDYGMRWGRNLDQRISLRLAPHASEGMLYAYDPTWDEYAILQRRIPAAVVEAVYADAHLPVPEFARLIEAHRDLRTATPATDVPLLEP